MNILEFVTMISSIRLEQWIPKVWLRTCLKVIVKNSVGCEKLSKIKLEDMSDCN